MLDYIRRKLKSNVEKPINRKIDGWCLKISDKYRNTYYYYNTNFRSLWKIYFWYLTKESELYNIEFDGGYRTINRDNVVSMELTKTKLNEKDWIR